ncbi:hypothetical protein RRG08_057541 [Elysia crispata]|uniref:Uncharacterized protein n=1 Tax=Elysia crispata TaxID=231223 RepID=A0AAE1ACT5_9GAST|nr:hypothetical protein RRG08_057541 [Elysia crispata]
MHAHGQRWRLRFNGRAPDQSAEISGNGRPNLIQGPGNNLGSSAHTESGASQGPSKGQGQGVTRMGTTGQRVLRNRWSVSRYGPIMTSTEKKEIRSPDTCINFDETGPNENS